jgi:hypothetical protein
MAQSSPACEVINRFQQMVTVHVTMVLITMSSAPAAALASSTRANPSLPAPPASPPFVTSPLPPEPHLCPLNLLTTRAASMSTSRTPLSTHATAASPLPACSTRWVAPTPSGNSAVNFSRLKSHTRRQPSDPAVTSSLLVESEVRPTTGPSWAGRCCIAGSARYRRDSRRVGQQEASNQDRRGYRQPHESHLSFTT